MRISEEELNKLGDTFVNERIGEIFGIRFEFFLCWHHKYLRMLADFKDGKLAINITDNKRRYVALTY